jgi:hypothetical protein
VIAELPVVLFVYTFAAFGLAYIVGHSVISKPVRLALYDVNRRWSLFILDLVECPACFGFWIGLIAALTLLWFKLDALFTFPLVAFLPLYTSGANYTLGRITRLIREE